MSDPFFIELYFDEDVIVLVAELVRARGFSALTTLEAGNLGSSDDRQLEYAVSNERAFVTHNRIDFENQAKRYFEDGRDHFGIIILARRFPNEIASRLFPLLNSRTKEEMKNQIVYI